MVGDDDDDGDGSRMGVDTRIWCVNLSIQMRKQYGCFGRKWKRGEFSQFLCSIGKSNDLFVT